MLKNTGAEAGSFCSHEKIHTHTCISTENPYPDASLHTE